MAPLLYDPQEEDLTVALQRCTEMIAFLHDALWQEKPPAGHGSYPVRLTPAGVSGLVWWLHAMRATLNNVLQQIETGEPPRSLPRDALAAYLSCYPEQSDALVNLLAKTREAGFTDWGAVEATIGAPPESKQLTRQANSDRS